MRRKYPAILGAGVTALAVAGTLVGVQYLDSGTDVAPARSAQHETDGASKQSPKGSKESASVDGAQGSEKVEFKLTYVPDGFHVSDRDGPAKIPSEKTNAAFAPIMRSVHYNNLPTEGQPAAFGVITATDARAKGLQQRKAHNPQAYWTTIHGHRAVVEPSPKHEPGLQAVEWHVAGIQVSVVGRGMTMDQVLRIAKGVRLR